MLMQQIMKFVGVAGVVTLLVGMAACSTFKSGPDIDWAHGARLAWIVGEYDEQTDAADLPKCFASLSQAELMTHHLVKVHYWHRRHMHASIVELPAYVHAHIGDEVEVLPKECTAAQMPHITRLLVPAS